MVAVADDDVAQTAVLLHRRLPLHEILRLCGAVSEHDDGNLNAVIEVFEHFTLRPRWPEARRQWIHRRADCTRVF